MPHNIEFNKDEKRVIQYELYTVSKNNFIPNSVSIQIKHKNNFIVNGDEALVEGNKISIIIDTNITSNPGTYYIRWKIIKNNQIFYKMTILNVKATQW